MLQLQHQILWIRTLVQRCSVRIQRICRGISQNQQNEALREGPDPSRESTTVGTRKADSGSRLAGLGRRFGAGGDTKQSGSAPLECNGYPTAGPA